MISAKEIDHERSTTKRMNGGASSLPQHGIQRMKWEARKRSERLRGCVSRLHLCEIGLASRTPRPHGTFPLPSECGKSANFDRLLKRAMASEPDDCQRSVGAFRDELEDAAFNLPPQEPPNDYSFFGISPRVGLVCVNAGPNPVRSPGEIRYASAC